MFFDVGDYENEFIAQLGFENADEEENDIGAVDVKSFLEGIDTENFWHYDGSFTTPPCTEGVEWFVMQEVQSISQDQLNAFQSYGWGNGDFENGEGNNRRTQPLYERTLYNISVSGADDEETATGEGEGADEAGEDATGEEAAGEAEEESAGEADEEAAGEADEESTSGNNVDIKIAFNVNVDQAHADE